MQVLFIIVAVVVLLLWWNRQRKRVKPERRKRSSAKQPAPVTEQQPASVDIRFRARGERSPGGPVYGDVLCSDGVYLPQVWESDFHTSFDGRWIRTGSYGGTTPQLIDRQSRRSWHMDVTQAAALDDMHWRLPRWGAGVAAGSGHGMAVSNSRKVMSDSAFEEWLSQHMPQPAQMLVGVVDLWMPQDALPAQAHSQPPVLPQPEHAAVTVGLQRHWPTSLRALDNPIQPVVQPQWQLLMNGEPQRWRLHEESAFVWRADGQAFACYGHPLDDAPESPQRLAIWSAEHGRQQWSQWCPADRKPWDVVCLPDVPQAQLQWPAQLYWEGDVLHQTMQMDTPVLERLRDGRSLTVQHSNVNMDAAHEIDGAVRVQSVAPRQYVWRRDPQHPQIWQAQSLPVAGKPLLWQLAHEAQDEEGATAAYTLFWGEEQLPGLWELEHMVVEGRWALLLPWGDTPVLRGGSCIPWVWDGAQLKAIAMPAPVLRMRPHARMGCAQVLTVVGCGPDHSNHRNSGIWRWPLQLADGINLAKPGWSPAYEWRTLRANAQGEWKLMPRWRVARQVQHPCADGDYVWRLPSHADTIWWWGGVAQGAQGQDWSPDSVRTDGVLVTQTGAVLCGVSPSVCPHYAGDGWLALEWVARGQRDINHWRLHWLRPSKKEVYTVELRAALPILQAWDAYQGVQWLETGWGDGAQEHEPVPQVLPSNCWYDAQRESLKQSAAGLWVRKQDAVYVDTIVLRDDWPWVRQSEKTEQA